MTSPDLTPTPAVGTDWSDPAARAEAGMGPDHDRKIIEGIQEHGWQAVIVRCPHVVGLCYYMPKYGEAGMLADLPCPCNDRSDVVGRLVLTEDTLTPAAGEHDGLREAVERIEIALRRFVLDQLPYKQSGFTDPASCGHSRSIGLDLSPDEGWTCQDCGIYKGWPDVPAHPVPSDTKEEREAMPLAELLATYSDGDERGWDNEFALLEEIHSERLDMLASSIQQDGIRKPILLGNDGRVWDGHHRLAVASRLALSIVPVKYAETAPEQINTCPCHDPLRAVLPRCPIHGDAAQPSVPAPVAEPIDMGFMSLPVEVQDALTAPAPAPERCPESWVPAAGGSGHQCVKPAGHDGAHDSTPAPGNALTSFCNGIGARTPPSDAALMHLGIAPEDEQREALAEWVDPDATYVRVGGSAVFSKCFTSDELREHDARVIEAEADAIQALHPGEVKNSVLFLRERARIIREAGEGR